MVDAEEHDLVERLEAEWPSLAHGPLAQRLYGWAEREPALAPFATAMLLLRWLQAPSGSPAAKNEVLAALVRQAREDPLAGRVVLQALLPGLKRQAGRLLFEAGEREELWSLLLGNLWLRIRAYPLARRPEHIAANLLGDAVQASVRELERARRARRLLPLEPLSEDDAEIGAADDGSDVLRLLADAVRAGVLSQAEAALIFQSRFAGFSVAELAERERLPYITLYMRRQRAEQRLLAHLGIADVKNGAAKAPSFSARAVGSGLRGSAGRGAATHLNTRR
jgi:DNA-directed RNA polymerase specialized sigma24 family protein